jgi:hypothetical protein
MRSRERRHIQFPLRPERRASLGCERNSPACEKLGSLGLIRDERTHENSNAFILNPFPVGIQALVPAKPLGSAIAQFMLNFF